MTSSSKMSRNTQRSFGTSLRTWRSWRMRNTANWDDMSATHCLKLTAHSGPESFIFTTWVTRRSKMSKRKARMTGCIYFRTCKRRSTTSLLWIRQRTIKYSKGWLRHSQPVMSQQLKLKEKSFSRVSRCKCPTDPIYMKSFTSRPFMNIHWTKIFRHFTSPRSL